MFNASIPQNSPSSCFRVLCEAPRLSASDECSRTSQTRVRSEWMQRRSQMTILSSQSPIDTSRIARGLCESQLWLLRAVGWAVRIASVASCNRLSPKTQDFENSKFIIEIEKFCDSNLSNKKQIHLLLQN